MERGERGGERGGYGDSGKDVEVGKTIAISHASPQPLLHGGTVTQCNIYILYAHIGFIHVNKEL